MKKRIFSIITSLVLVVSMLAVVPSVTVSAVESTGNSTLDAFINDSRWANGVSWGSKQKPKLSSYSCSGCCAYCADYAKYCHGNNSPRGGTVFYDTSEIRAGDILTIGNQSNGTGHWFVCLKRSGDSLYVAEGNASSKVRIGWNYTISGNKFAQDSRSFTAGYHFMNSVPDAPQLSINTKACTANDTVNISWPSANGATSYWLHIYRNGNDYINQSLGTSLSYSSTYPKGEYTAYVTSCNSAGETSSYVNFTVYGDKPGKPSLSINKTSASINDTIKISWSATSNTEYYWLHIYKDGKDYENKSLGTALSYSNKYPAGKYRAYIVSINPCGETLSYVDFKVYGENPGKAILNINKTKATPDDTITITWDETSNTEHYWLHIYKDHEDYENKSLGTALSYSNKYPVGQYKAYIVPMNPYGETLSYVEFTISETAPAELKYQLRQNNDSTDVRFILVADEQAVINADSASVYATIDDYGDTDSIVIKRAYRSIKAGGKTITADEGKVFLIGKFIGIPDDMINGMVGHFTLGENTYERTIAS